MNATVFLPCRKGSERVPQKNTRPFAHFGGGLIELKLNQLMASDRIERIVLSTDDEMIIDHARALADPRLDIHRRADDLASSSTSTDELVGLARDLIPSGLIIWTHVTSPFVSGALYDRLIAAYERYSRAGYDSLMTVSGVRGFLWNSEGPINYDRRIEKWPRTQTLEPLFEVNSAAFIAPASVYRDHEDRIGLSPYLFELEGLVGFDIDWPEQFSLAELLVREGMVDI